MGISVSGFHGQKLRLESYKYFSCPRQRRISEPGQAVRRGRKRLNEKEKVL